jgi:hypothetical protein
LGSRYRFAEEQLVDRRDLIALRGLLRVVAVVVLPGSAGLHQLAVDVDLDGDRKTALSRSGVVLELNVMLEGCCPLVG